MHIEIKGSLSSVNQPYILEAVEQGLKGMPPGIKKTLSGVNVNVANKLIDIDPKASSKIARGYRGKTLDYSSAFYRASDVLIAMAQENRTEKLGEYEQSSSNRYRVYFHEAGHAFDDERNWDSDNNYSSCPAMREAYEKDIRNLRQMPKEEQLRLVDENDYFFSKEQFSGAAQEKDDHARREVFAEAFSNILSGSGSFLDNLDATDHKALFYNSYKVVEHAILSVDPHAVLYPRYRRHYPSEKRGPFGNMVEFTFQSKDRLTSSYNKAASAADHALYVVDDRFDRATNWVQRKLKTYGPASAAALLLACMVAPEVEAKFLPDTDGCKIYKKERMSGPQMMGGVFTLPLLAVASSLSDKAHNHGLEVAKQFDRNKRLSVACKL